MRIELNHQHKSIADLETEDLPDFAVLIGRNGAGKTQILEALTEGRAVIPGIAAGEIVLYDMVSFRPPNTARVGGQGNQFAQDASDAYLLSPSGSQAPIDTAMAIFDEVANDITRESGTQAREDFERNLRDKIRQVPDFDVFAANDQGSPYEKTLYERVLAPLTEGQRRRSSSRSPNSFNRNRAALLTAAMKLACKLPHELTHDDRRQLFLPVCDNYSCRLSSC